MVFGWFKPRSDGPRRLKVHDVEVNFHIAGQRQDTSAKLDQNIYSDGGGLFQLRVRNWPRDQTGSPLQLWRDSRMVAEWPMPRSDLKLRINDPFFGGIPRIEFGSMLELRKGGYSATGIAEAD